MNRLRRAVAAVTAAACLGAVGCQSRALEDDVVEEEPGGGGLLDEEPERDTEPIESPGTP